MDAISIILICVVVALALILIKLLIQSSKNKKDKDINYSDNIQKYNYVVKSRYISIKENEFFQALKNIIGNKYLIYPQVPLSQIIEKIGDNKYRNELFRIIDFCIFDREYKPLVCIEINDQTHNQPDRIERDKKVKDILSIAGMPLITLWTEYGIKPDYIRKRLQDYINV